MTPPAPPSTRLNTLDVRGTMTEVVWYCDGSQGGPCEACRAEDSGGPDDQAARPDGAVCGEAPECPGAGGDAPEVLGATLPLKGATVRLRVRECRCRAIHRDGRPCGHRWLVLGRWRHRSAPPSRCPKCKLGAVAVRWVWCRAYRCRSCGWTWVAQSRDRPSRCAHCKSRVWWQALEVTR